MAKSLPSYGFESSVCSKTSTKATSCLIPVVFKRFRKILSCSQSKKKTKSHKKEDHSFETPINSTHSIPPKPTVLKTHSGAKHLKRDIPRRKLTNDPLFTLNVPKESTVALFCTPPESPKPVTHTPIDCHGNCVDIYREEILSHLRFTEMHFPIQLNFIESRQKEMDGRIRDKIVKWFLFIHGLLNLMPETLFQAVAIFDHYIQIQVIKSTRVQLCAYCSLSLASKYCEQVTLPVAAFNLINEDSGKLYTSAEISRCERHLLYSLEFKLNFPLACDFLGCYLIECAKEKALYRATLFILELTLLTSGFSCYPPSLLCYSALALSQEIFNKSCLLLAIDYDPILLDMVKYDLKQLLVNALSTPSNPVTQKYSNSKNDEISICPQMLGLKNTVLINSNTRL